MPRTPINTPLDLVDRLSDEVADLVAEVNDGRNLTPGQFAAAHARAFREALPEFLNRMEGELDAEHARELTDAIVAEYETRHGNGA